MTRRRLQFDNLDDAVSECNDLLESGYSKHGKWSLGDACQHITLTIEANMDGYAWWMSIAAPIRPIMRWLMLPKLLRGDSPAGLPTASSFVPSGDSEDAEQVNLFAVCVSKFHDHTSKLHPHPGFGHLSKEQFEKFHAAHMAHHLGFLEPNE
jgi:hypothetical protein